mmetsp:Transcript_33155/g.53415  ORF Transcript_33155/g.53415 Transcript_33155/m.53415 type:complete len:221 (-) Transcript_33155:252-914(-)
MLAANARYMVPWLLLVFLLIMSNGTPAAKTRNWSRESTYFCDMRSIWPSPNKSLLKVSESNTATFRIESACFLLNETTSSKVTEPPALFLTDVLHNCRPRVSVTNGSVLSINPAEFLKFAIFNTLTYTLPANGSRVDGKLESVRQELALLAPKTSSDSERSSFVLIFVLIGALPFGLMELPGAVERLGAVCLLTDMGVASEEGTRDIAADCGKSLSPSVM